MQSAGVGVFSSTPEALQSAQIQVDSLNKKLDELRKKQDQFKSGSVPIGLTTEIESVQKRLGIQQKLLADAKAGADSGVQRAFSERKGMTDEQKGIADSQKQRDILKRDHDDRLADLQSEMQKLDEKKIAEEQAYTTERTQLELTKAALGTFVTDYSAKMATLEQVTEDTVKNMAKKLDDLKSTISSIDALLQSRADLTGGGTLEDKVNQRAAGRLTNIPKFGDGGTVYRPTLAIVGEKGPERITPLGKETTSSSVTITFGDVHIAKEVDADEVIRKITRSIQLHAQAA
jgi:hypothetical protein